MATPAVSLSQASSTPVKVDGRRERSASSRRRILDAMVDLIEKGEPSPTAEAIALRAGVSLRTVFRHFEEMENLHIEIASVAYSRIKPILERQFEASGWPEILYETIQRRADFFEEIAPFKVAMDVNRHRSEQVAAKHKRMAEISRDLLLGILPPEIKANGPLTQVLEMLLSSESWQRLREQQNLSREEAETALRLSLEKLLDLPAQA